MLFRSTRLFKEPFTPWISIVRYENLLNSHKVFLKSMTTLVYIWNCYLNCDVHSFTHPFIFTHMYTCNIHICFNILTGIPGKYWDFTSRPLEQSKSKMLGLPSAYKVKFTKYCSLLNVQQHYV